MLALEEVVLSDEVADGAVLTVIDRQELRGTVGLRVIDLLTRVLRLQLLAVGHRLNEYVFYPYEKDQEVPQIGYGCVCCKWTHLCAGVSVRDQLPRIPDRRALLDDDLLVIHVGEIVQSRQELDESLEV